MTDPASAPTPSCRPGDRAPAAPTRRAWLLATIAALALTTAPVKAQDTLTVFAAASLTNALEALGKRYRAERGVTVRHSFAASSTLARQIESGAPADVFVSADEQWMDWLAERRLVNAATRRVLVGNRLVLVAPADAAAGPIELRPGVDLAGRLAGGRLATGDPAHVPVGRYARQSLTALGAWNAVEPRLVRSDSVRAALVLVERGEVPLGIVYQTDALAAPRVKILGVFPDGTHAPIRYPAAVVAARDTPAARDYLAFLASPAAREVFRQHGFPAAPPR